MDTDMTAPVTGIIRRLNKRTLVGGVVVLFVIVVVAGYSLFFRSGRPDDAQKTARRDAEQLVGAVGKLITLPDEEPLIATVTDPTQLGDQPFFKNAKVGDKVLIYNVARKVILYRPSGNVIVDVAPLSTPPSATSEP